MTYKHVAGVVGTFIFAYDFSLFTYRARFAGAYVGVKLMLAINSVQLALIELEYSAADCLRLEAPFPILWNARNWNCYYRIL